MENDINISILWHLIQKSKILHTTFNDLTTPAELLNSASDKITSKDELIIALKSEIRTLKSALTRQENGTALGKKKVWEI